MKKIKKEYYFAAVLLIIFVILTMFIVSGNLDLIDKWIFNNVITIKNKPLSIFLRIITNIGSTVGVIVLLGITAFIFIRKKSFSDFKYVVINVGLGALLMEVIKNIVRRIRPVWKWIPQGGFSFPSGHTISALLFYGTLLLLVYKKVYGKYRKPLIIFFSVMIILIGFSRIYFGVHYSSDVVGGYLLGTVILLVSNVFMNKEFLRHDKNKNSNWF